MLKFLGKGWHFLQTEAVLSVSLFAAVLSAFFVPPSSRYLGYINYQVLSLLFCLMAVAAGLRQSGLFVYIAKKFTEHTHNSAILSTCLTLSCFFIAMFLTNDVALIVFVPFTIYLLKSLPQSSLIFVIVMETIAANLGSMLTPIGNPQNLFLYYFYHWETNKFLETTVPIGLVSFFLIALVMCGLIFLGSQKLDVKEIENEPLNKFELYKHLFLLVLSLFTIFKILNVYVFLLITLCVLLASDRQIFAKIDYILLLTFVCFFVFVGNLAQIDFVRFFIEKILSGHEFLVSVCLSQVISNVPAAIMLSSFTDDSKAVLLGVNVGGLGTMVASLASLISYRFYSEVPKADKSSFYKIFTLANVIFLAILILFCYTFLPLN